MKLAVMHLYSTGLCAACVWLCCGALLAADAPTTTTLATVNSLGMTLVEVSPGEFLMGEKDYDKLLAHHANSVRLREYQTDSPAIPVRITRPFQIAAHEVTLRQFRQFVEATGYKTDAERDGKGACVLEPGVKNEVDRFAPKPQASWRNPGFEQTDDHPVTCVSWHDAVAFCQWLSKQEGAAYRLPTEAEWEFACRAGTDTIYSSGDDPDAVYAHGNVGDAALERVLPGTVLRQRVDRLGPQDGDGYAYTAPVGKFEPNALGLYDMHGNVWEWCQDRYHDRYYMALDKEIKAAEKAKQPKFVADPQGPETTPQHKHGDWRSVRGGSWYVSPISCRSASRSFAEAGDAFSYIGFRVVRELKK